MKKTHKEYPDTKFLVASDFHYFSPKYKMKGRNFNIYVKNDRKMIKRSNLILKKFIQLASKENFDFLIIPGDLTKDGEYQSHIDVAKYLRKLENHGKDVYVICGNHDVNNFKAREYNKNGSSKVNHAGYKKFKNIYKNFGYKESLYQDKYSLSYVAEPVDGLWLIALDSCMWQMQTNSNSKIYTDGRIPVFTYKWLENILIKANKKDKRVIVFMHHGLLEHYKNNNKYLDEYLVDDYKQLGKLLSFYNVKTVFTGHFHSQDIVSKKYSSKIYDIETGSLVTYPSPYRIVEIKNSKMHIKSKKINSIKNIENFQTYALKHARKTTKSMFSNILNRYPIKLDDTKILSNYLSKCLLQHFRGDEEKIIFKNYKKLSLFGKFAYFLRKELPNAWQNDLNPADNNTTINLK